jgi:hypothetical protein
LRHRLTLCSRSVWDISVELVSARDAAAAAAAAAIALRMRPLNYFDNFAGEEKKPGELATL